MADVFTGPMNTQPGKQGGLGHDPVAPLPPGAPKDPLGLVPSKGKGK